MKFIKAERRDTDGSSFDGYLFMPYEHLVECLGTPHDRTQEDEWRSNDGKVRSEWAFKSRHKRNPTVITIYDYKECIPVNELTLWHVGIKGDDSRFADFYKEKNLKYLE